MQESIQQSFQQLQKYGREPGDFFKLLRDHILLDQLEWAAFVQQIDGCPQCKPEQMTYGPDYSYPFIKHITTKEINKKRLITEPFALKLKLVNDAALKVTDKPRIRAFVDDQYCGIIDLARAIIKLHLNNSNSNQNTSSTD